MIFPQLREERLSVFISADLPRKLCRHNPSNTPTK